MQSLLLLAAVGIIAGVIGSLLGLGGGMVVTPILTMMMGLDIKYAIGASVISVIATSSGASIAYLKDDMLNLRVAMFLEIATTIGAISGALLAGVFSSEILFILFGVLLAYSAFNMVMKLVRHQADAVVTQNDQMATKLKLNGSYYDKVQQKQIDYSVTHVPGGFIMMLAAGLASGLLGIGSGAFKVIAMDTIMKMPLKPSSATSNLMMGVTAAASATVYFFSGAIRPEITAPLAVGVLVGATLGSRIMQHLSAKTIRIIFVPIILYMGVQMILKGFGINI